jgi:hypothetical protein
MGGENNPVLVVPTVPADACPSEAHVTPTTTSPPTTTTATTATTLQVIIPLKRVFETTEIAATTTKNKTNKKQKPSPEKLRAIDQAKKALALLREAAKSDLKYRRAADLVAATIEGQTEEEGLLTRLSKVVKKLENSANIQENQPGKEIIYNRLTP